MIHHLSLATNDAAFVFDPDGNKIEPVTLSSG
jgi:hypothetical protein